ncbi:hypothetical protein [Rahnella sp. NRRL B-41462]|uniref:hypothetical protein n=1 Tax=Rahnella sp. NRRL B-41462 TaxID=1610579 RepID=UPI000DD3B2D0|nr:hypothetical protein [Rahnella sp. NRRL B-41462]
MDCDFILFGHGHEGALRNKEYNGDATVSFMPAVRIQGFRPGEVHEIIAQQVGYAEFNVVRHRSEMDGNVYLLAVADGVTPEGVDLKILGEHPRPAP